QAAEARQQPQPGHADAGGDRHRTTAIGAAKLAGDVLQLLDRAVGAAEEALAFGREADAAMLAPEELDAEMRLQRMDLAADRRLGEAEIVGGERDAHAPADGDEPLEQVEREQADERNGHGMT